MKIPLGSGICLIATMSTYPAIAQEDSRVVELEPIIVTGGKRPQEELTFPGIVAQQNGETLRARGVSSAAELDRVFPGVAIDNRSARVYSNFTIRGQSSLDYYNPSTQIFVDGLPQDPGTMANRFPAKLENVELLYGPQGSLYGKGAVGGVINITTVKPGEGAPFSFDLETGTEGYSGFVSGEVQLGDGLWADLAISKSRDDDYLTDMITSEEVGGSRETSGRFRLRYAPEGSPLNVMFSAGRTEVYSEEERFVVGTNLEGGEAIPFPSMYDNDVNSFGLTVNYEFATGTLSALTGYQDRELARLALGTFAPEAQETLTQEVRFASDTGGPLEYVAGIFLSSSDFSRVAGGTTTKQDSKSFAAFADLTWEVNDRLSISPGLRFDYEETTATAITTTTTTRKDDWNAVSPKLAVNYELSPGLHTYGLISSGFVAGGFNRNLIANIIDFSYDPATTWNGEAGLKYRSAGGRFEASLAAYYSVTNDYQMYSGLPPIQYLDNVGEVTSKGVDLNLRYSDGALGVNAGVGLNSAKFTDYFDRNDPTTDLTGNRVPYAPQITAQLAVDYTFDLGARGTLTPRLGISYQDEVFFDEANIIGQDSYWLADAGVAWVAGNGTLVDLYVTNLTDETYASLGFDASFVGLGDVYQVGRGREVGIRVSREF